MLGVLYTDFSGIIEDDQTFERLLSQLPANMQEQVKRYKRRENRWASLLGKLLIQKGLTALKMVSTHSIADLRYSAYGRPAIKNYPASKKACIPCILKDSCTTKSLFKRIFTTTYEDYYHRAHERQHSRQDKQMKRLRQSTIEPVFGSLVNHYGLSKINVLGKTTAHKLMLMSASCFNLKKYLKTSNRKLVQSAAKELTADCNATLLTLFDRFELTS